jgi:L-fucose isomerase-like protein
MLAMPPVLWHGNLRLSWNVPLIVLGPEEALMTVPLFGLLFLGRKRPGFDPDWGARIKKAIRDFVEKDQCRCLIPADNVADDAALRGAVEECRRHGARALVVTQPTISDGRLSPILAQLWDGPLVLWATPEKPTGRMISSNSLVGTHVFAANLGQLGKPFELVYGHPEDSRVRGELLRAIRLTATASKLRRAKVGLFGYHAPGFLDFHVDPAALSRQIGAQLYHESVPELISRFRAVSAQDIDADLLRVRELGIPEGPLSEEDLRVQSRYYLALRNALTAESLDALALRCWPELPTLTGHWPYLALSRLMTEGKAVTMEGDVDGALCSMMAEELGLGPVHYTDWLEHDAHTVVTWHTGAVPFPLCEPAGKAGAPVLGVQFNNKRPTVVEATLVSGLDATLFRLWRCDGGYRLTALEGRLREPRRALMAVNGLFEAPDVDLRHWFDERVHDGMPHHLSLVRGHHADSLGRLARLAGWRRL